jgi:hypothetical protein
VSMAVVVDTASVAGFRVGGDARVDGRRVVSLIFAGGYRRKVGSAGERFRGSNPRACNPSEAGLLIVR